MNFYFIYVELYDAIERYDITAAETVCSKAKGNINFSDTLIFVVENNMDAMFNVLKGYGARFDFYSEFGVDLILTAITKRNFGLYVNLLSVGIRKNTIDHPNAIPILLRVLAEIFRKGTVNEYNRLNNKYPFC